MSHALTPVTPTTPAAVATNLAASVPDGSDFRTAGSLYGAFQAILNLASIAALFVTGGTIGDGTGSGVTLNNAFSTSNGKDIQSGNDLDATRDVNAARDVNATNNVNAGGSVHATGNVTGVNVTASGQGSFASYEGTRVLHTLPTLDADHTYDCTHFDLITRDDAGGVDQSANRIWTIANGVRPGQYVRVVKDTAGFSATLKTAAAATIAVLNITSGTFRWVGLMWTGTTWRVQDFSIQP